MENSILHRMYYGFGESFIVKDKELVPISKEKAEQLITDDDTIQVPVKHSSHIKYLFRTCLLSLLVSITISCSTSQTFAQREKDLLTPQLNTIKITWCDMEKVYYIDEQGNAGYFKNKFKETFFVGDIYFKVFFD
jgi:hypothetical protein